MSSKDASHFRPDIEGLRAVAILAVLAYHARLPLVHGGFVGVDVFFVISGFLITGLLLREIDASGSVDLPSFYARRARRLLPAALVVIAVTLAVSSIAVSIVDFSDVALDGAAAAIYVSNYRFALSATDYFAAGAAPSPFLHYWSLGVEEQFYLFWPLLLLVSSRLVGRGRIWIPVAIVAAASFAISLVWTQIEAPWAFYSLPTRAWQLALGALVALGILVLPARWPAGIASIVGLVGAFLIAVAVLVINESTPFPGVAALLPSVGTALLIVAGERSEAVTARLLATRVPRWFGRISYSLYLWHWPVLILVPLLIGHGSIRVRIALAVASVIIAALSTRFIETPFRIGRASGWANRRTLATAGALSLVIALGGFASQAFLSGTQADVALPSLGPASATPPPLPAAVVQGPIPDDLVPSLAVARRDKAPITEDGCQTPLRESALRDCVYGDPDASTTAVLIGDSHAAMWMPALKAIAEHRGWRLIPLVKPACPAVDVAIWRNQLQREFFECSEWRQLALERIDDLRPDMVIMASSLNYTMIDENGRGRPTGSRYQEWSAGMVEVLERMAAASEQVIILGETPHHADDPLKCLAAADRVEDCTPPRSQMISEKYAELEADAARAVGAEVIDTTAWLCQPATCSPIIGNYLVYRDRGHLTATISRVLAPQLQWALEQLP